MEVPPSLFLLLRLVRAVRFTRGVCFMTDGAAADEEQKQEWRRGSRAAALVSVLVAVVIGGSFLERPPAGAAAYSFSRRFQCVLVSCSLAAPSHPFPAVGDPRRVT
ncbi:hypothetical protein MRX96_012990 [Rhipicephalus microplus]